MFYNSLLGVSGVFTTIDPDNTGYVDYCKTYPVLSGSIVVKRPDTPRRLL
jgi:hypothetical protein